MATPFPQHASPSQWLTMIDAARALRMSDEGVRKLVRKGQLPCERTRSGQYLFRAYDVERLGVNRAREAALATVRPRMLKARLGPRQQKLFDARFIRRFAPWLGVGDRQPKGRAIVPGSRRRAR